MLFIWRFIGNHEQWVFHRTILFIKQSHRDHQFILAKTDLVLIRTYEWCRTQQRQPALWFRYLLIRSQNSIFGSVYTRHSRSFIPTLWRMVGWAGSVNYCALRHLRWCQATRLALIGESAQPICKGMHCKAVDRNLPRWFWIPISTTWCWQMHWDFMYIPVSSFLLQMDIVEIILQAQRDCIASASPLDIVCFHQSDF